MLKTNEKNRAGERVLRNGEAFKTVKKLRFVVEKFGQVKVNKHLKIERDLRTCMIASCRVLRTKVSFLY